MTQTDRRLRHNLAILGDNDDAMTTQATDAALCYCCRTLADNLSVTDSD